MATSPSTVENMQVVLQPFIKAPTKYVSRISREYQTAVLHRMLKKIKICCYRIRL